MKWNPADILLRFDSVFQVCHRAASPEEEQTEPHRQRVEVDLSFTFACSRKVLGGFQLPSVSTPHPDGVNLLLLSLALLSDASPNLINTLSLTL